MASVITMKPGDVLKLEQSNGQTLVVSVGENELIVASADVGSRLELDRAAVFSMRVRAEKG